MISRKELEHIERAMEIIEGKDDNYTANARWLKLREAQNLWYEHLRLEKIKYYKTRYKETGEENFLKKQQELENCMEEADNGK